MLKKTLISVFALTMLFALTVVAGDKGGNKMCPISGGKVNESVYVDYKDMRVFFCCNDCPAKFNADPETYLKKMADAGDNPMKLEPQSVCPVSGMKLATKEFFVDFEGKRIYICCGDCVEKVKADPKAAMKKIADRGEYVADTPAKDDKSM